MYQQQRKVRERRAAVVRRAQNQFENSVFGAPVFQVFVRTRLEGARPPTVNAAAAEALYNVFIHKYMELRGRVPAVYLCAITILKAAKESGEDPKTLPQNWTSGWFACWLHRFRARVGRSSNEKNHTVSLSHDELCRRSG